MTDDSKNATVHVTFIDDQSGNVFGETDLPGNELPASFDVDSIINLGTDEWVIVAAEPATAAEAIATGKLTLRLSRVEVGFLNDDEPIHYILPTINDVSPQLEDGPQDPSLNAVELLEDNWRQIEFISERQADRIEDNFAAIRDIYQNERDEEFFQGMHVREEPTRPLDGTDLRLADIQAMLDGEGDWYDGFGFAGANNIVRQGFAINCNDLIIYGRTANESLIELCLFGSLATPAPTLLEKLRSLMADHHLQLVDWCAIRAVQAENLQDMFDLPGA